MTSLDPDILLAMEFNKIQWITCLYIQKKTGWVQTYIMVWGIWSGSTLFAQFCRAK